MTDWLSTKYLWISDAHDNHNGHPQSFIKIYFFYYCFLTNCWLLYSFFNLGRRFIINFVNIIAISTDSVLWCACVYLQHAFCSACVATIFLKYHWYNYEWNAHVKLVLWIAYVELIMLSSPLCLDVKLRSTSLLMLYLLCSVMLILLFLFINFLSLISFPILSWKTFLIS